MPPDTSPGTEEPPNRPAACLPPSAGRPRRHSPAARRTPPPACTGRCNSPWLPAPRAAVPRRAHSGGGRAPPGRRPAPACRRRAPARDPHGGAPAARPPALSRGRSARRLGGRRQRGRPPPRRAAAPGGGRRQVPAGAAALCRSAPEASGLQSLPPQLRSQTIRARGRLRREGGGGREEGGGTGRRGEAGWRRRGARFTLRKRLPSARGRGAPPPSFLLLLFLFLPAGLCSPALEDPGAQHSAVPAASLPLCLLWRGEGCFTTPPHPRAFVSAGHRSAPTRPGLSRTPPRPGLK